MRKNAAEAPTPGNTRRKDDMSEESRFDIKIREDRIGRYFRKYLD